MGGSRMPGGRPGSCSPGADCPSTQWRSAPPHSHLRPTLLGAPRPPARTPCGRRPPWTLSANVTAEPLRAAARGREGEQVPAGNFVHVPVQALPRDALLEAVREEAV